MLVSIEPAVGATVVVEVHRAVEIGVAVIRVFDEQSGVVDRLVVELRGGTIDALEFGGL